MQKVKLFKSIESELETLEADVNIWIAKEKVKVISISGNIAPQTSGATHVGAFSSSDILIIVHYEVAS